MGWQELQVAGICRHQRRRHRLKKKFGLSQEPFFFLLKTFNCGVIGGTPCRKSSLNYNYIFLKIELNILIIKHFTLICWKTLIRSKVFNYFINTCSLSYSFNEFQFSLKDLSKLLWWPKTLNPQLQSCGKRSPENLNLWNSHPKKKANLLHYPESTITVTRRELCLPLLGFRALFLITFKHILTIEIEKRWLLRFAHNFSKEKTPTW